MRDDERFSIAADKSLGVIADISAGVEGGEGAWFAKEPWQRSDLTELPHREDGRPWFSGLVISSVSTHTLAFAHEEVLPRIARTKGNGDLGLSASMNALRERVINDLRAQGYTMDDEGPADLISNRPGALSTAYDYEGNRFIGLHIDDHEKLSWVKREESLILASVNIGWTERFLYVVPLRASQLLRRLARSEDDAIRASELKDEWFRRFPQTKVLRLTLPPKTAYLLNTQNVIHDGGTPEGNVPDVTFLMLGRPA